MSWVSRDILATIPFSIAIDESVFPIREIGDTLVLATSKILHAEADERIRLILNRKIRYVFRSSAWIAAQIREHYDHPPAETVENGNSNSAWYWPHWHSWHQEILVVKASGWSNDMHWTGAAEFPPTHEDYAFWAWLVQIPQYHRLVDESEIPSIKRIWNRYRSRTSK